jgi:signal transduction histidine kinase
MERRLFRAQKLESLGILSAGIAHDFNNLLAVIVGNLELAQNSKFSSSQKDKFIERSMSASVKSTNLIRQMLDYSGKGAFELEEINLSELVQENARLFEATAPQNTHLEIKTPPHEILIKADPSQLKQVIMNLLMNASEALEGKEGTLELSAGVEFCDEAVLAKSLLLKKPLPQNMPFLRVKDDGCGMDAETVNCIFDPFFSTKFTGRGLGMSVVQGIVRGHGGAIMIESLPGRGTTVTVYLPVAPAHTQ